MKRLKKIVAYLPMWTCYWIGDFTSRIFEYEVPFSDWLYSIYNRFMMWSHDIDQWADMGLWVDSPPEDTSV